MKKKTRNLIVFVLVAILLLNIICTPLRNFWYSELFTKPNPNTPNLELELVYEGEKPYSFGSIQSMVITQDYYVLACRPYGSREDGGEENNRLVIIDRDTLKEVTNDFPAATHVYQLGHANGMVYVESLNEILVVDIVDDNDYMRRIAHIDAKTFAFKGYTDLPRSASGIAFDESTQTFFIRYKMEVRQLDYTLTTVLNSYEVPAEVATQDLAFYGHHLYLTNWVDFWRSSKGSKLGLKVNQNYIRKFDPETEAYQDFYVLSPRQELEGIDFTDDGDVFLLYNGRNLHFNKFYIYRVKRDQAYERFIAN